MAKSYLQTIRGFNRDVRLYLLLFAAIGVSFFGIYAVVFNLYLTRLGFGPEFVGLANGSMFISLSVFCVPAGWLGRRFGSRRMVLMGLGVNIAAFISIPFAESVPPEIRAGWVLAGYSLFGLAGSAVVVNTSPFLMSITEKEERGHAFSMQNAVTRFSGFFGNLLGGLLPGVFAILLGTTLDSPAPFRFPLMIPPVLYSVGFVLLLSTKKQTPTPPRTVAQSRAGLGAPSRLIMMFSFAYLLWMAGSWSARTFFNVYMDQRLRAPAATIGAVMAMGQLMAVPGSLLMPVLMKKFGSFHTVVATLLALVLSQIALAMLPYTLTAALAFVGAYVAFGMASPAFMLYCQEAVAPEWRPVVMGFTSMSWGLGTAALVFGGGYIAAGLGYRALFLTGAAMTLLGALIFLGYFRIPRGEFARQ